jgi:hypothetical protein
MEIDGFFVRGWLWLEYVTSCSVRRVTVLCDIQRSGLG